RGRLFVLAHTGAAPPLSDEQRDALREDIGENGVEAPVVGEDRDGRIEVFDGANRVRIAAELGLEVPLDLRDGLTEQQKDELAFRLNYNRRHHGRDERREGLN